MRAALLALLLAAPAAAQAPAPGFNPGGFFPFMPRQLFLFLKSMGKVLVLPYRYSLKLPEEGFAGALYREDPEGDTGDQQELHRYELHALYAGDDKGGAGARYRFEQETHVGAEGLYTQLRERGQEDLHYFHAVALGDALREDQWRLGYQFGAGGVLGRYQRVGPRAALSIESFPLKPVFFEGVAGAAFASGATIGDLRAGAGVAGGRWQLRLGWRVLSFPAWFSGPDAALTVRF